MDERLLDPAIFDPLARGFVSRGQDGPSRRGQAESRRARRGTQGIASRQSVGPRSVLFDLGAGEVVHGWVSVCRARELDLARDGRGSWDATEVTHAGPSREDVTRGGETGRSPALVSRSRGRSRIRGPGSARLSIVDQRPGRVRGLRALIRPGSFVARNGFLERSESFMLSVAERTFMTREQVIRPQKLGERSPSRRYKTKPTRAGGKRSQLAPVQNEANSRRRKTKPTSRRYKTKPTSAPAANEANSRRCKTKPTSAPAQNEGKLATGAPKDSGRRSNPRSTSPSPLTPLPQGEVHV